MKITKTVRMSYRDCTTSEGVTEVELPNNASAAQIKAVLSGMQSSNETTIEYADEKQQLEAAVA